MSKTGGKSPANQVRELEKLVRDAQSTLDQTSRALESLRKRLDGAPAQRGARRSRLGRFVRR